LDASGRQGKARRIPRKGAEAGSLRGNRIASPDWFFAGVLDRRDKDAITLLFAVVLEKGSVRVQQKQKEIKKAGFQKSLPKQASPSAKYFWSARSGPVKKAPKIRASTHQFPVLL
jgi:hypothetical protein